MVFHNTLTDDELHPFAFVQSGNPGAVGANIAWVDTSEGSGLYKLKLRNAADTGWETLTSTGVFQGVDTNFVVWIKSNQNTVDANGSYLIFQRSRGTTAVPTAVLNGDVLGIISFRGYQGSNGYTGTQAAIVGLTDQNWTNANHGTQLVFQVTPNNSTTLTNAMAIYNDLSVEFFGTVSMAELNLTNFLLVEKDTSDTTGQSNIANFVLNSTGTPSNDFGQFIRFAVYGGDLATLGTIFDINIRWTNATHATRTSQINFQPKDFNGGATAFSLAANGTEALVSFFGVTPVVRQSTTVDIKDALTSYGLLQGTSATPLNLDGGTLTAGALTVNGTSAQNGLTTIAVDDASNNSVTNVLTVTHTTTGSPANNLGTGIVFVGETSSNVRNMGRIRTIWNTVTDASREAEMIISVYDTTERDAIRITTNSSVVKLGLYGVTPVVRPSTYAAMTGSGNRNTTYDTTTITLAQLATRVKAIQDDLTSLGALG